VRVVYEVGAVLVSYLSKKKKTYSPVIRIESPFLQLAKSFKDTNLAEGIVDIRRSFKT
jgi:hypothetical protein